jgi:group II intron reverse transcriptase/maturase
MSDESFMHAAGESHDCVVPAKVPNKDPQGSAEGLEGRRSIKENTGESNPSRTQSRAIGSRGLEGVRETAKRDKGLRFTALLHHITEALLRDSFYSLQRQAAPGVDQVTWQQYAHGMEARIKDLHGRVHRGAYRAQPSRRIYIPKADGRRRPLGIAALEDKIVQRAVVMVLEAIYEEDFIGFSYGFRPDRGAHDALDALTAGIVRKKVNWILDADIRGFFDNLDHGCLMQLIERRVGDPRVLRLIQKWLKAGVSEDGKWSETKVGTPQGAVISPLLANIYLHYVLDQWVIEWRKKFAMGDVMMVRYADDIVLGFQHRKEAERFLEQLQGRLREFGLELHPEKTRLIQFGRYAAEHRQRDGEGKPETFDFLGFTHICGTIKKTGRFTVKRKTVGKRMAAKLKAVKAELRRRMHEPIRDTGEWLRAVVRGYFTYHAVPGNFPRLRSFRHDVIRHWWHAVRRRGQRSLRREVFDRIAAQYLPTPAILHPYPLERFCANYPR